MNKNAKKPITNAKKRQKKLGESEVSPAARRKQIFLGLAMGLVVGLVISFFTTFWYWLPAGLAFGLAVGAIMKPPPQQ